MQSLKVAFKVAGFKIADTCICGQELPENSWYWSNRPDELFCSEECCLTHTPVAEQEPVKPDLADIRTVLSAYGLPFDHRFLTPDGLAVVALLCNAAAKGQEWGALENFPWFYDLKPGLVAAAAWSHPNCWYSDGIVYFETSVGQLSFHVFEEESDTWQLLPSANGRQWAGGWMQDNAASLALAFVNGGEDDYLEYRCRRFLSGIQ